MFFDGGYSLCYQTLYLNSVKRSHENEGKNIGVKLHCVTPTFIVLERISLHIVNQPALLEHWWLYLWPNLSFWVCFKFWILLLYIFHISYFTFHIFHIVAIRWREEGHTMKYGMSWLKSTYWHYTIMKIDYISWYGLLERTIFHDMVRSSGLYFLLLLQYCNIAAIL